MALTKADLAAIATMIAAGNTKGLKKQTTKKFVTTVDADDFKGNRVITLKWGEREYVDEIRFGLTKWAHIVENIGMIEELLTAELAAQ